MFASLLQNPWLCGLTGGMGLPLGPDVAADSAALPLFFVKRLPAILNQWLGWRLGKCSLGPQMGQLDALSFLNTTSSLEKLGR